MTAAQLDHEVAVEWTRDDALELAYVRESVAATRTIDGPPPSHNGNVLVGWALLHRNTPTHLPPAHVRYRRYWWLRDTDSPIDPNGAFTDDVPAEAVDPGSITAGTPSRLIAGMEVGR